MSWSTLENWSVLSRHSPLESVGAEPSRLALEMAQGGRPVLTLDGDHPQVEEHERVVGPLGQLGLEDLAIAVLEHPFPRRRVGVASVPDRDLGTAFKDKGPGVVFGLIFRAEYGDSRSHSQEEDSRPLIGRQLGVTKIWSSVSYTQYDGIVRKGVWQFGVRRRPAHRPSR